MKQNNGFSYIEVLIAVALLSMITIPVMAALFGAANNYNHASAYYESSLLVKNMNVEVKATLRRMGEDGTLADFLNTHKDRAYAFDALGLQDVLAERFKPSAFYYTVMVCPIDESGAMRPNASCLFTTNPSGVTPVTPLIQGRLSIPVPLHANKDFVIQYDNTFHTIKSGAPAIAIATDAETCTLRFHGTKNTVGLLTAASLSHDITLKIENESVASASASPAPQMIIEVALSNAQDKEKLHIDASKNVTLLYKQPEQNQVPCIIRTEVYAMDHTLLVKAVDMS